MLTAARQALADAVTGTGLTCSAYPPDSIVTPSAFIDVATVAYQDAAGWFCSPGDATFQVVTIDQRNDISSAVKYLEERVPGVVTAIHDIGGATVTAIASGSVEVGGQTLPAVTYSITAQV